MFVNLASWCVIWCGGFTDMRNVWILKSKGDLMISVTRATILTQLVFSRQPLMRILRYVLVSLLMVLGVVTLLTMLRTFAPAMIYRRDFLQEYLLARSVIDGLDPYTPLPELVQQLIGEVPVAILPHSTPHPPPVILFVLPLGILSYPWASAVWSVLTLLALLWIIFWQQNPLEEAHGSRIGILVTTLIWLGWRPFMEELLYGQLMILLLFLLVAAWRCVHHERNLLGGVLLGLVFAFKLMVWPILLFFAIRKDWKLVSAALVTIILLNLGAMLLITPEVVINYYIETPAITSLYRNFAFNFSVWIVGWRLFEGTFSPVLMDIEASPLIHAPFLAPFVTYAVLLGFLVAGLMLAQSAKTFDTSFGILLGLSTLVNPVAWVRYFTWLAFPLTLLVKHLLLLKVPSRESWLSIMSVLVLTLPASTISRLSCILSGVNCTPEPSLTVTFAAGLLTYIQPVCVVLLMFLLWRVDRLAASGWVSEC